MYCSINLSSAVMTPKEITTLFRVALGVFEPITGQPSDIDVAWTVETTTLILLTIPFDKLKGKNLIGSIISNAKYRNAC